MHRFPEALLGAITLVSAVTSAALPDKNLSLVANALGVCSGLFYLRIAPSPFDIIRDIEGITSEAANRLALAEKEIAKKRGELERIAQQQLAEVQLRIDAANQELEQDKAEFLAVHESEIEQYQAHIQKLESRIEFLEAELAAAELAIAGYEAPKLPEGVGHHEIVARRVIEILAKKKIIADYRGAWIEDGWILVRVRPRDCGEREIKRYLNQIQIELDLAEPVRTTTKHGSIQLWLKPQELLAASPNSEPTRTKWNQLEPDPEPNGTNSNQIEPDSEPNGTNSNQIEPDGTRLKHFIEPDRTLDPYGPIAQVERDWVLWLWYYHEPKPIRNRKRLIQRLWGASAGNGTRYALARERLKKILLDAGIES